MSTPRYTVDQFNDIPGIDPTQNGRPDRDSWLPLNLADLDDTPPQPPTLGGFGIVYHGKRHVFSGPQESAKTLAAYAIGIETLRAIPNRYIAIIDFEMGRRSARTRLLELGATQAELARILYIEPEVPANIDRIALLVAMQPQVVIIDAAAGAYALQSLDDNNRGDVERFAALYTNAFFQAGIATITLDHVVKNTETRGKYAIGSERKTGGVDVHLGFDTILPIKRGSTGLYKITTHKDRDGWHERGRLADLHLTSHPDTHQITWEWRQTEHGEHQSGDVWMPTMLMEKLSHALEGAATTLSRNQLESAVNGSTDHKRAAIDHLSRLGYIKEDHGPRGSRLYIHLRPFTVSQWEDERQEETAKTSQKAKSGEDNLSVTNSDVAETAQTSHLATSPDLASTSPGRSHDDLATSPPPPRGRASVRERRSTATSPDDPEVTAMLEQYGLNDSWIDELTPRDHPPHDLHQQEPT
jgi:hypothetical protein